MDQTEYDDKLLHLWQQSLVGKHNLAPMQAVIKELGEYFKLSPEEVWHRCVHWEQTSVEEWQAGNRSTEQGLLEFYNTQTSWIFDTMRYHAEQCVGQAFPESVIVAAGLRHLAPGHHLDFGAGPGTSSLFFHELGWRVSLADVSTTFQDFAKWRLAQHHVPATFYNSSQEQLPAETFDLITAFDVMVHVPNMSATLAMLHRSLKPGGYLVFNIDNRERSLANEPHLYQEQYPILGKVRRAGFRRLPKIAFFHVYQKTDRTPLGAGWINVYDRLRYNYYVTAVGHQLRRAKAHLSHARPSEQPSPPINGV